MATMDRLKRSSLTSLILFLTVSALTQEVPQFVRFEGQVTFNQGALEEVIAREIAGARATAGSVADLIDAVFTLETWYQSQGFPEARIVLALVDDRDDGTQRLITEPQNYSLIDFVVYRIEEGPRIYLGKVEFTGNVRFSDETLSRYVPRRGGRLLGAGRPLFRRSDLQTIVDSVRRHYQLQGFLRAEVGEPVTERTGNTVNVTVPVQEGRSFVIGQVTVTGTDFLSRELGESIAAERPQANQRFTERVVADAAQAMESQLARRGYLTEVRYQLTVNEEQADVVVAYSVVPAPRSILGELLVETTTEDPLRTQPAVVRRQFSGVPGEPVNRPQIEAGRRRLYQTGLFTVVTVEYVPREKQEDAAAGDTQVVDVLIRLEEAQSRFVSLSVGYSTFDQLLGSVQYTDNNVFGSARSWSVQARGSSRGYRLATRLADTLLLGSGSLLALTVAHELELREAFQESSYGAGVAATVPIAEDLSASAEYELSIVDLEDLSMLGGSDPLIRIGRLELAAVWDTVDRPLFPTDGLRIEAETGYSGGPLGSQLEFIRLLAGATLHKSFAERFVFTAQAEGETILPGGDRQIPISERLYAGGSTSVRAFAENTISPVDSAGNALGGLTRLEATVELRISLLENLYLALFGDAASVSSQGLAAGPLAYGLGLGLRYDLPVGPLRIDGAVTPGPTFAAESRWAVHIGIGSGF